MRTTLASLLLAALLVPATTRADPARCPEGLVLTTFTRADGRAEAVCAIHVGGELQRPYPFDVSSRSPLGYTYQDGARTFAPDVFRPLRRSPF